MKFEIKREQQIEPFKPFNLTISFENSEECNKFLADLDVIREEYDDEGSLYGTTEDALEEISSVMKIELRKQDYLNAKK